MKWALVVLAVVLFGCSSPRGRAPRTDYPSNPGGECFWSIKEGAEECVVEIGGTTRSRSPQEPDELLITEGFGKKKWACGERRQVCGTQVECTCRSWRTDAQVGKVKLEEQSMQEVVFTALRERALDDLRRKRNVVLCASVGPESFYREPDESVLVRLNAGREDKLLSQFRCNPMPLTSTDGSLHLLDQGRDQEGRAHVQGTINFGRGVGHIGSFVLTKRDGAWTLADVSWRPYGDEGKND